MKNIFNQKIIIILIIQTLLYIFVGFQKSYIHIDEAYSFGLTHYDKVEIKDNEDFYNTWHTSSYYEDYLSLQEDETESYSQVYENQKNDVHPPVYYLLLRIAMEFTKGHFSKWPGIVLNIIIYAFITIFSYLIIKELMKNDKNVDTKSAILAFMSSVTLASLSNAIYIRMYALATLNILVTTFLHIKLLKNKKPNLKLLIEIFASVLIGVLTHYYYLFYLAPLYIIFFIKYLKNKDIKSLIKYTLAIALAGIVSIAIFPYSIQHMFLGYRGKGVISSLENVSQIFPSIFEQLKNLNYYAFNGLMLVILISIIGLLIYNKISKQGKALSNENKEILILIFVPCIFFFIITSIASPWKVLRYFVPICGLVFIITIYYLYKLLQKIFNENLCNKIMIILFCIILISPIVFNLQPELLYSDYKETVESLEDKHNLPSLYLYNSKSESFLNNILAFTILDESYILKSTDISQENIKIIFENKDISEGIIVFSNENNTDNLSEIMDYLSFTNCDLLGNLNSYNVYCLY